MKKNFLIAICTAGILLLLILVFGRMGAALAQSTLDPSNVQSPADVANYIQSILNSQAQNAALGATASSSDLSITVSPDPAETGQIVAAVAVPRNRALAATGRFSWYVNGALRTDLSGIGQSSAFFVAPSNPGTMRVRVLMETSASSTTAEKVVRLEPSAVSKLLQGVQDQVDEANALMDQMKQNVSFTIDASPENPQPGDQVTFTARSFQVNLDNADITWLVNGKEAKTGKGLIVFTTRAGAAGSVNDVEARIHSSDGSSGSQSITLAVAPVQLYWWASSYVPLWYKGKALPSSGSTIFIQARPAFPKSLADVFIYNWYLNDNFIESVSGQGKSVFAYRVTSNGFSDSIQVKVSNISRTIRGEATFNPPAVEASALIYEVRPLEGIVFSNIIQNINRAAGKALDMIVEPFFAPKETLGTLHYQWNLNGKDISNESGKKPRSFTLTSTEKSSGVQNINISLEDASQSIEASQSLKINLQ